MIIKHESNNTIRDLSENELIDFVDQAMKVIRNSKEILDALQQTADGDIDEDDELDLLESCHADDIKSLIVFKNTAASVYNSINYYVESLCDVILNNNRNIDEIVDSGVYVTDEWAEILKKENERIIGGLCYVLWYEFNVDSYYNTINDASPEIDQVLKGYFDTNNIDVASGIEALRADKETYKFKLMVFDEYPEKEDDFLRLMGPDIGGIDPEALTIELVNKVLSGDMTPQELCDTIKLNKYSFEDAE